MKKYKDVVECRYFKSEVKKLISITCDICGKEIKPGRDYRDESAEYVEVHTWHNDWGNDSCESDVYQDMCKYCAAKFVSNYIFDSHGSQELEISIKHASVNDCEKLDYIPIRCAEDVFRKVDV